MAGSHSDKVSVVTRKWLEVTVVSVATREWLEVTVIRLVLELGNGWKSQ